VALRNLPFELKKRRRKAKRKTPRRLPNRRKLPAPGALSETKDSDVFCSTPARIVQKTIKRQKNDSCDFTVLSPRLIPQPQSTKLLRWRGSERWARSEGKAKTAVRALPFVTREGYVSYSGVYYTRCSSYQWFSSVVSTVYDRLMARRRRWSRDGVKKIGGGDLNLQIALTYVLTMDTGFLIRAMECQKRSDSAARKFVYYKTRHMDEPTRFWYDQSREFAGSWLQHRSKTPRDKSINCIDDVRIRDVYLGKHDERGHRQKLDSISDPWIRTESACNGGFLLTRVVNRDPPKVPLNATKRVRGVKAVRRSTARLGRNRP
jgi:hypothetical protein